MVPTDLRFEYMKVCFLYLCMRIEFKHYIPIRASFFEVEIPCYIKEYYFCVPTGKRKFKYLLQRGKIVALPGLTPS